MKPRLRLPLVLLTSLLLGACSSMQLQAGRDFDPSAVSARLERGVSDKAQVQSWLGAPAGTGVAVESNGERFDEWTYYYASGRLDSSARNHLKFLQIKFDAQGIVRAYNWSSD